MKSTEPRTTVGFQRWLDMTAAVAVICAAGTLAWSFVREEIHPRTVEVVSATHNSQAPQPIHDRPIVLAGAATLGNQMAPVAIVEYSEFQCPYCGQFANKVWPEVQRSLIKTGKVLFAFRHFPLVSKHHEALRAAEEAECARRQGHFWDAADLFFQGQAHLKDVSLRSRSLGLDAGAFQSCLAHDATAQIQHDIESGRNLSITGTPTFIIGDLVGGNLVKARERLVGVQSADRLVAEVDKLIDDQHKGHS